MLDAIYDTYDLRCRIRIALRKLQFRKYTPQCSTPKRRPMRLTPKMWPLLTMLANIANILWPYYVSHIKGGSTLSVSESNTHNYTTTMGGGEGGLCL